MMWVSADELIGQCVRETMLRKQTTLRYDDLIGYEDNFGSFALVFIHLCRCFYVLSLIVPDRWGFPVFLLFTLWYGLMVWCALIVG